MVTVAAKALGCTPKTIRNYRDRYPSVREAITDSRDQMLDVAELQLAKQINNGNISAIIFYLKTQGKQRGYIERSEVVNYFGVDETLAKKLQDAFAERGVSASDVFNAMLAEMENANVSADDSEKDGG